MPALWLALQSSMSQNNGVPADAIIDFFATRKELTLWDGKWGRNSGGGNGSPPVGGTFHEVVVIGLRHPSPISSAKYGFSRL